MASLIIFICCVSAFLTNPTDPTMPAPKLWLFRPEPEAEQLAALRQAINVSEPTARMLIQRGITDFEEARRFFRPQLEHLHDPFGMKDMDRAVERLCAAIEGQEKVLVYGDYDVDGTTSVAMFLSFLGKKGVRPDYYIPDRYSEGYGISRKGIEYAVKEGVRLIISLDCGIKAHTQISYAADQGIDFIVCDHHEPDGDLPPALAVLDPKRPDCPYPNKNLSGCGVGFKLLQGLCQKMDWSEEQLFGELDLVAVSTACDIVPVTGENRVFMTYGLQRMNDPQAARPSFSILQKLAGMGEKVDVSTLVFGIGPRINAAGRIVHASQAVRLLIAEEEHELLDFASQLNERNNQRRQYDSDMTLEALSMIRSRGMEDRKTTVLFKEDWHKGVVGIVASRCIEHYHRPTVILTRSDQKIVGSARSVADFDLYAAISACGDLLQQYGGHRHAAGLTLSPDLLPAFVERFEQVVAARITPAQLQPTIIADSQLHLDQINDKFYRIISQMAPFGPSNMQPVFVTRRLLAVSDRIRILKDKHLKMSVFEEGHSVMMEAIAFQMAEYADLIRSGQPFDLCYSIEQNTFQDKTTLQLYIRDIRPSDTEPTAG